MKKVKLREGVVGHVKFQVKPDAVCELLGVKDSSVVAEVYAWTEGSIKDKYIVLKAESMKEQYRTNDNLIVKATGGFGCSKNTMGSAVYVTDCYGKSDRFERYDVLGTLLDITGDQFFESMQPEAEEVAELGAN